MPYFDLVAQGVNRLGDEDDDDIHSSEMTHSGNGAYASSGAPMLAQYNSGSGGGSYFPPSAADAYGGAAGAAAAGAVAGQAFTPSHSHSHSMSQSTVSNGAMPGYGAYYSGGGSANGHGGGGGGGGAGGSQSRSQSQYGPPSSEHGVMYGGGGQQQGQFSDWAEYLNAYGDGLAGGAAGGAAAAAAAAAAAGGPGGEYIPHSPERASGDASNVSVRSAFRSRAFPILVVVLTLSWGLCRCCCSRLCPTVWRV